MMNVQTEWDNINVYSDVVDNGLILPKKKKYTMTDARKLMRNGVPAIVARWIIVCSAAFHKTTYSKVFNDPDGFVMSTMF